MKEIVSDLRKVLSEMTPRLTAIPDGEFSAKPLPHKWSKKEVIGHLIDSAQSNLRRFVSGQYESTPKIVYEQDFWVSANDYQNVSKGDVLTLWRLVNDRICSVLLSMPEANYERQCNVSKGAPELKTLAWLAADYVRHMKHHMNQVIPNAYNVVYPQP